MITTDEASAILDKANEEIREILTKYDLAAVLILYSSPGVGKIETKLDTADTILQCTGPEVIVCTATLDQLSDPDRVRHLVVNSRLVVEAIGSMLKKHNGNFEQLRRDVAEVFGFDPEDGVNEQDI